MSVSKETIAAWDQSLREMAIDYHEAKPTDSYAKVPVSAEMIEASRSRGGEFVSLALYALEDAIVAANQEAAVKTGQVAIVSITVTRAYWDRIGQPTQILTSVGPVQVEVAK